MSHVVSQSVKGTVVFAVPCVASSFSIMTNYCTQHTMSYNTISPEAAIWGCGNIAFSARIIIYCEIVYLYS